MAKSDSFFLYLVTGEEFLRKKKIEELLPKLSPDFDRATDLFRVYPDDLDWPHLLTQARTPSLLGGPQIFWISDAHKIKGSDWSLFEAYLNEPTSNCYFIFEGEELSLSHPLIKLVQRCGRHIHDEIKKGQSSVEFLRQKLQRFHKTMTPEAWQVLEDRCGGSLSLMSSCLDQLISYGETDLINEEVIQALSVNFLRYDVFDLTEAILRKDTATAIKIFHYFFELNGDITSTTGLLHWQLKRIWQAKKMLTSGIGQGEIGRSLRISPARLPSFLRQSQSFKLETLERLIHKLWRADWNSKTGASDEMIELETFLASVN